jgi:hypothetical protein
VQIVSSSTATIATTVAVQHGAITVFNVPSDLWASAAVWIQDSTRFKDDGWENQK